MGFDAFISYRREGGYEMARLIQLCLQEKGVECFLDLEEARVGEFDKRLLDAIRSAPNFILILTPGALDRCVNEGDWVRREIEEAAQSDCTIIPVYYPDFQWPTHLYDKLPPEVVQLEKQESVLVSREYHASMIQTIFEFMRNVKPKRKMPSLHFEASRFILDNAASTPELCSVDMAFHAGSAWSRDSDKVETLCRLQEMKCKLRVLINSVESVEKVCAHMRQPMKRYVRFDRNLEEWRELASEYPDTIEVRVLDVPLLHRLYIVRGKNGGCVNVKYYSYGNYIPEKDFRLSFAHPDAEYTLYTEEFDYLWQVATPIS